MSYCAIGNYVARSHSAEQAPSYKFLPVGKCRKIVSSSENFCLKMQGLWPENPLWKIEKQIRNFEHP